MAKPIPQAVFQPADGNPRQSCAGPSLLELMWATLIEELGQLMPGGDYHEDQRPMPMYERADDDELSVWAEERARIQGACQGISSCIALVLNPYLPDVDAVKAEAVERWVQQEAVKGDVD